MTEEKVLEVLVQLKDTLSVGGPFACGTEYSLADVPFTRPPCRAIWAKPLVNETEGRPNVAKNWELVKNRPSFDSAYMWPAMRPKKLVRILGARQALPCFACDAVIALLVDIIEFLRTFQDL